ncbi:MAG TPA: choice-of-anchor tandem repeat GloVer-containing protein, partial [Verrucomicrobiae bacterium]
MRKFRIFLLVLNLMVSWLAAPLAHGQIPGVTFTTLGAFNNTNNGANPYAPPVLGADGNLYGTLPYGGTNNAGAVYRVTTNAFLTTLYTFKTNFNTWDGAYPYASLVSGHDGNLYGVAGAGGTNNQGTIFEITTNGTFTLLYSFGMETNTLGYALDGSSPDGGLVQGRD